MVENNSEEEDSNRWRTDQSQRLIGAQEPPSAWVMQKLRSLIARDIRVARQVGHLPQELLKEQTRIEIPLDVLFDDRLEQVVYVRTVATRSRKEGLIQGIEVLAKLRRIEAIPKNRAR